MDVTTLRDEFATLLGDTTTAFKSKVLVWMNDIENEISISHTWSFLRSRGSKTLTASQEIQKLSFNTPNAPTAVLVAGGSLVDTAVYLVKVAFYDSLYDVESLPSAQSASLTATGVNKQINLSVIPISADIGVTSRRIYLSKNGGAFYLQGVISDNTTTIYSITTEPTSVVTPETDSFINKIDGSPFLTTSNGWLKYQSQAQFQYLYATQQSSGLPDIWSDLSIDKISVYPRPSEATVLNFNYFKKPRGLFVGGETTIPRMLKEVFEAGVEYKGYKYRDRDGYVSKKQIYDALLKEAIEDFGSPVRVAARVRDVMGSSDGFIN